MASALSAMTIAIMTTISRSPGRLRWGDWAGLCMAAAYAPMPPLWIVPEWPQTQRALLCKAKVPHAPFTGADGPSQIRDAGSALAGAGHRHRSERAGLDRAGKR